MFGIEFKDKPEMCSPLQLAYIGDCVYEVYVRTRIISEHPELPAHTLHKRAVKYVKAHSQSMSMEHISNMLSDAELAVYKRGRNAKPGTVPKNADVAEYHSATGFEALIGFLYLKNDTVRLSDIMDAAYAAIENF